MRFSDAQPTEKFPIPIENSREFPGRRHTAQAADTRASVEFSGDSYKNDLIDCADYSDFEIERVLRAIARALR
jgi:hypothetical protein